jgi:two-component system cell cycle sensor histidine kinase/response regulator CckA
MKEEILVAGKRLEYLLSAAPVISYTCEPGGDHKAAFVSENVKLQLGYEAREFVQDPGFWARHIHAEDRPHVMDELPKASDHGLLTFEYRFMHKDGHYRWIYDQLRLVRDARGNPLEIVGSWVDITRRKQAEEALKQSEKKLRESEEKYRILVGHVNDAIFVLQGGVSIFHNRKTEESTGFTAEELARIPFGSCVYSEDREEFDNNYLRLLRKEETPGAHDFRLTKKNGEQVWVRANAVPVTWEGRPAGLYFARDITREKRLEARIEMSQRMEAMGVLARGLAHDFNNLLTVITSHCEFVLGSLDEKSQMREDVERAKKAAMQAHDLILKLIVFGHEQVLHPKIVDLNAIITEKEKTIRCLVGMKVQVRTILQEGLERIKADPEQLEQVIMNLAINAGDGMPRGGILTLETANADLDKVFMSNHGLEGLPGPYVMLAVSDTGVGIAAEVQSRIFEPFFTTKEKTGGTGLGLSLVYGIVKQSGGQICVYSDPGQGATFKIYFPRAEIHES